ncbi:ankyrin repeat-containing domain protein [Phialemonium atrogriseum]|uniref:Ankyrin repeat-containing domain protein n=1 Tax=Phialemonium atrogriseum TaxID=1093897 RepID=A0AAJ0C576_9PEZI|nr:ankyrin repeat-containing domain protein [Phialemonium atrogriseum]KAK1767901.1 ankyrin repeat-containing domain protein [Phialemonium atrogriseum]
MGCVSTHLVGGLDTSDLDAALQDDEFVRKLILSSRLLSEKSRQNLSLLVQSAQGRPQESSDLNLCPLLKRNDLKRFLTLTEADISLHKSLVPDYQRWSINPATFFESLDMRRDGGLVAYLARQRRNASLLESGLPIDRVRLRIYMLFYAETHGFYRNRDMLEEITYSKEYGGQKYRRLASILGKGCIFLLPPAIPDSVWETRLPLKGGYLEQAAALLKRFNIVEKAAQIDADRSGDIAGLRELWRLGLASIDVMDPYGLGLLYYAAYYCWRSCGTVTAMATCKALLEAGANYEWVDEIGNTPMETMIDALLAESAMRGQHFYSALREVGQLFGKAFVDLWREYRDTRGFTELHEVLLGINYDRGNLDDYLNYAAAEGTILDLLDATDSFGRSALSWAIEHGWTDAAATLIRFGANVNQRMRSGLPMLHLALAGPASGQLDTAFLDIVKVLLLAGADANAIDHEGWTPLHVAASWNSYAAVSTLIEHAGQDLNWNAATSDGKSAAQLAADSGGDAAFIELLASHEQHGPYGSVMAISTFF